MTDRPILFSAPMVRALLAGTKTQTRRIVKPQPVCRYGHPFTEATRFIPDDGEAGSYGGVAIHSKGTSQCYKCPYAQRIGDRLWVRETWQQYFDDEMPADRPRGPCGTMGVPATPDRKSFAFYRADGEADHVEQGAANWCPSIHMPRWASRITLEITGVRVERLQEISEADANAEGVEKFAGPASVSAYRSIWETINGPGSWDANPWVWVVEFKRVTP